MFQCNWCHICKLLLAKSIYLTSLLHRIGTYIILTFMSYQRWVSYYHLKVFDRSLACCSKLANLYAYTWSPSVGHLKYHGCNVGVTTNDLLLTVLKLFTDHLVLIDIYQTRFHLWCHHYSPFFCIPKWSIINQLLYMVMLQMDMLQISKSWIIML